MKPIKLKNIKPETMYIRIREPIKAYYKHDYNEMWETRFFKADSMEAQIAWLQYMFTTDLFFMLYYGFNRTDINSFDRPFILLACKMIENGPQTDTVDLWSRGHYKLLSDDTPVLTPSGWTIHGNLKTGDFVFSPQGIPVEVLATTKKMHDPQMYDVLFTDHNDERKYKLCAGSQHLWDIEFFDITRIPKTDKRIGWTESTLSTKELIERTLKQQKTKNPKWYRIPRAKPLLFKHKKLPVEPYTFGAWIGDGTSSSGAITNNDYQLWERIRSEGYSISHDYKPNLKTTQTRTVYGISDKLPLGNKHIPEIYLFSSLEQRLALFQGLMDTDGSIGCRGDCVFVSIRKSLADDFVRLIRTLGLNPNMRYYEYEMESAGGVLYGFYQISFVPRLDTPPFSLDYHKKRLDKYGRKGHNYNYWYIKDVIPVKRVSGQCIQVEGDKYLAGKNLIPTHNSTLITQAKTLQDLLKYLLQGIDMRAGIFSHTRPIAKGFLIPIKSALENSFLLRFAFSTVLWENPKKDAPVWSLDEGLEFKSKTMGNTRNLEAWGLIDGMPTGKHYNIRVYDDVITEKTANSPEMIQKAEDAFRLSDNLGTLSGIDWQRIVGTIYNFGDFYCTIKEESENGTYDWIIRQHIWSKGFYTDEELIKEGVSPDYINVFGNRKPRLLTWQKALSKRKKQKSQVWACQNELSPIAGERVEFNIKWLKYYRKLPDNLSLYLFIDPANEKKKTSDYTVIVLMGVDTFGNRFLVDMIRDKLHLGERWKAIRDMVYDHGKVNGIYYEKYGKDSDIWYLEQKQLEEGAYFGDINSIGGGTSKPDRIRRLIPVCEEKRFFLPERPIIYHGRDLVKIFIDEEYTKFPFCRHDDMLDAISRIEDPAVEFTKPIEYKQKASHESMVEEHFERISCEEQI